MILRRKKADAYISSFLSVGFGVASGYLIYMLINGTFEKNNCIMVVSLMTLFGEKVSSIVMYWLDIDNKLNKLVRVIFIKLKK